MNIRTSQREQVLASGVRSCWFVATDGCPRHIFPFRSSSGVSATRRISRGEPDRVLGYNRLSIPAKATRRNDGLEFSEVEIGDGLEGFGRGCVAEAVGQGIKPG